MASRAKTLARALYLARSAPDRCCVWEGLHEGIEDPVVVLSAFENDALYNLVHPDENWTAWPDARPVQKPYPWKQDQKENV